MILVIDNYDSFVFNLVRYCKELGETVETCRNDAIEIEDIRRMCPDAIILSPGPGRPIDAGITIELIGAFSGQIPILGVCLGHQAIGEAFGGQIVRAIEPMHGRSCLLTHSSCRMFKKIPSPMKVGRYHSLVIEPQSLPSSLKVTAYSNEGEIMALEHLSHPTFGVQFHPESILTEHGHQMIENFLALTLGGKNVP